MRLSFEAADELFSSMYTFAKGLIRNISRELKIQKAEPLLIENWAQPISSEFPFSDLSDRITDLCESSDKEIVLMIDEVDKSSDNQIFLSFLGLLRNKYLERQQQRDTTFHSVILAGVYDIKNLKLKLHPGEESKYNSPWNVAADFTLDLSFYPKDIAGMLAEYEADHHTGMDIAFISQMLYEYTSGYPYLVSRLCQLIDERVAGGLVCPDKRTAWTKEGILEAVRIILREPNTLFDDMIKHLYEYSRLSTMLKNILFQGRRYTFEADTQGIQLGMMFGFLKEQNQAVCVANRIFETKLYNFFLSEEEGKSDNLSEPDIVKNQF